MKMSGIQKSSWRSCGKGIKERDQLSEVEVSSKVTDHTGDTDLRRNEIDTIVALACLQPSLITVSLESTRLVTRAHYYPWDLDLWELRFIWRSQLGAKACSPDVLSIANVVKKISLGGRLDGSTVHA